MRLTTLVSACAGLALGAGLIALLPRETLFVTRPSGPETAGAETGERWACPMMDFIGNRQGDCPVCGMKMTKVTAGELTREQQRRMEVETSFVSEGPARALVRGYGAVRADDRTAQVVIARVAGRIVKRHDAARHAGALVKAGEPVVDLYSPEVFAAQGELAAAVRLGERATIAALTERFERWNLPTIARAILDGGAPTDTVTVSSPFAGRVIVDESGDAMAGRLPRVGQEIMADTPLLQLVDPAAFMVVVHVPEARAHWLRVGQSVRIASDDRGELPEVVATVGWVAPELNAEIRAREIHLHLRDEGGLLLAGSLVSARIEAVLGADLQAADPSKPETWGKFPLLPKTAVLSTGVRSVAWRVVERKPDGRVRFELAPVALGPRLEDEAGNDLYVVRAGLKPGDEVATQGVFLIDSQAQLAGTASLLFPQGAVAPAQTHTH